jgi:hypothetical protein
MIQKLERKLSWERPLSEESARDASAPAVATA